jgi:hypothetical protein
MINNELLEGSSHNLTAVLSYHLSGGSEENHKNHSHQESDDPADIQT